MEEESEAEYFNAAQTFRATSELRPDVIVGPHDEHFRRALTRAYPEASYKGCISSFTEVLILNLCLCCKTFSFNIITNIVFI